MAFVSNKLIIPKTEFTQKLPINICDEDVYLFKNELTKNLPEVYINYFENINVTPHGIIIKGFNIFKQFLIWPKHYKEFNFFYLLRNYINRKKINTNNNETHLICFDYWSSGYFHWMCDFLPRLQICNDDLKNFTLVLPSNHQSNFITESLKIFKFKNIIYLTEKEYLNIKNAVIPNYISLSGDHNPQIMLALRDKMIAYFKPQKNNNYRNIYISRAKAKGRFVTNEQELIKPLTKNGFTIIYFEDYTFIEQIEIMYNCENLIGIHGANLTNLLFMNPNSNILELRKQGDAENNYYFSLANTFKLNYFYLQCPAIQSNNSKALNINVNVNFAIKIVKEMLHLNSNKLN